MILIPGTVFAVPETCSPSRRVEDVAGTMIRIPAHPGMCMVPDAVMLANRDSCSEATELGVHKRPEYAIAKGGNFTNLTFGVAYSRKPDRAVSMRERRQWSQMKSNLPLRAGSRVQGSGPEIGAARNQTETQIVEAGDWRVPFAARRAASDGRHVP